VLESSRAPRGTAAPGRVRKMDIPSDLVVAASVWGRLLDGLEFLARLPLETYRGYSWLIRQAADSVRSLFEDYGYWVVFFGTLCENTLLVGLIVPGLLVVILAGLAAHDGSMSLQGAIALGILGTIIGDTLSYALGRFGWSRFGHLPFLAELNDKVREPILRRGVSFVLIYHFAGYTRVMGPTAAGLLRMPYRRWAPADYGGACLWILAYIGVGYGLGVLGLSLDTTDRYFKVLEWGLLVLAVAWLYVIVRAHADIIGSLAPPLAEKGGKDEAREAAAAAQE